MRRFCFFSLWLLSSTVAWGQEEDLFEFFQEEARVITASRRPQPLYQAPATVYVVSGEELKASGSQTLWDGLRRVPGVDVINIRPMAGVVSIRGLNKPLNNRTLVLVDGHNALDGYMDKVNWEAIPVLLEDIDRVEVVEGPTSALYGANAINGVINIITRRPEDFQGGRFEGGLGERGGQRGSLLYGTRRGRVGYKFGMGWRAADRLTGEGRAMALAKGNGLVDYQVDEATRLSFSSGVSWGETDIGLGGLGRAVEDGGRWYGQLEGVHRETRGRILWNGSTIRIEDLLDSGAPELDFDLYEASLEKGLALTRNRDEVVGASLRRSRIDSRLVSSRHYLWSLYFEDEWRFAPQWTLWTSGRLDQHPHNGVVLSPRFSLVCAPTGEQVVRFSAGSSFRNPTQLENHMEVTERVRADGDFPDLEVDIEGNTELDPERMIFAELAHNAYLGQLRTVAAFFHYRLRDVITVGQLEVSISQPGVVAADVTFINQGETRAWGGELGAEWGGKPWSGFVNYAYQRLSGELDSQVSAGGRPRHKVNGGVRFDTPGWQASLSLHRVGWTRWNDNKIPRTQTTFVKVDGYTLVNGYLGCRLPGRWRRLELGLEAFNLLDSEHFEILAWEERLIPGQGGELIGRRLLATLSGRL